MVEEEGGGRGDDKSVLVIFPLASCDLCCDYTR